jgi:hypothetical protein
VGKVLTSAAPTILEERLGKIDLKFALSAERILSQDLAEKPGTALPERGCRS